jgi:CheY-like chemotaxis protein
VLAAKGIGLPVTVFGDNPDDTGDLLAMLGPPPHVVKLNEGTQGNGVMLTEKLSASRAWIETLRGLYANFMVQEFIAEAKGADLRCFVVGDRVVAAMRRQAPKGDFRSNLHRGGTAKAVRRPTRSRPWCARRSVLGLGVAGVDLIRSQRGPLVLEVNSSPGLEGIEAAACASWSSKTTQDIAANLGDYLEDRGHTVDFAADGVTGLHLAVVHEFDAIVLDLNLPGMDGLEVCRKLRNEARKQTPVLMLTARDSLDNKLAGFDSGADDYLIKPFALQEVDVRLNALARRGKGRRRGCSTPASWSTTWTRWKSAARASCCSSTPPR